MLVFFSLAMLLLVRLLILVMLFWVEVEFEEHNENEENEEVFVFVVVSVAVDTVETECSYGNSSWSKKRSLGSEISVVLNFSFNCRSISLVLIWILSVVFCLRSSL